MSIQAVAWVLEDSQARGLTRLVLLSLANHANDDNECWPSQRTIAKEAGVSLGAVSNHVKKLVELGEVEIVTQGTHRRSTLYRLQRSSRELSVQPRGEQNHQEEDAITTSSSDSVHFVDFNAQRAVEKVKERSRKGLPVLSEAGLARTIQSDPDHIEESRRIWAHRDCGDCKGSGFVGEYSPGAGMRQVECSAVPGGEE